MPDIEAHTPDGTIHSFPDGTPDDVVDKVVKEYISTKAQKVPSESEALARPPQATNFPQPETTKETRQRTVGKFSAPGELTGLPMSPQEEAGVAGETAVTTGLAIPGAIPNIIGRGVAAAGGAGYGGKIAAGAGLPKWAGQAVGGVVGLFAPEAIGKLGGPLISRIATLLGKSAPEIATVISEDTIAQKVGRDVAERAARGEPLTPKDEELLFDQVQKHYSPEAGLDSAASKSGKIYAGRGTSFRPTNEQIKLGAERPAIPPPPSPSKIRFSTDSMGIRWAHSPDSPEPVSIPKSVAAADMEEYAAKKLADYVKTRKTTTFGK